ncbi:MAG: Fe-S cluster assembly protein SufD, partial [Mycobacterium sp.]
MTNVTEAVEGSALSAANSGSTLAGANKGEIFTSFDVNAFEV